ncbi:MAG: DUF2752 domain-containing protein [bacterium]|nr:DUF2752 domain-containing protein [bacterium]
MGENYLTVINRGKTFVYVVSLFLVLLGGIVIPFERAPSFTVCLFRNVTGLPCPSCGMGRGFLAMGELDITKAFQFNIISPLVFFGAFLTMVFLFLDLVFKTAKTAQFLAEYKKVILIFVAVAVILSWINNLFFNPHFR